MKKPPWLKRDLKGREQASKTGLLIKQFNLHTVCESARCPNKGECYNNGTATFLALGNVCTRGCSFCAVERDPHALEPPDANEPARIAEAAGELHLDYLVVTMVTRDDLPDGGAEHMAEIINTVKSHGSKDVLIEVLVSDFQGDLQQAAKVVAARPDVFNHNVETIPRLYGEVRPQADYPTSLALLAEVKRLSPQMPTKSGFMVGLGETEREVYALMDDLGEAGVDMITIGQYLAPSAAHFPVKEYVHPGVFAEYRRQALAKGFKECIAGPFVRSSYKANFAKKIITSKNDKKSETTKQGGLSCK